MPMQQSSLLCREMLVGAAAQAFAMYIRNEDEAEEVVLLIIYRYAWHITAEKVSAASTSSCSVTAMFSKSSGSQLIHISYHRGSQQTYKPKCCSFNGNTRQMLLILCLLCHRHASRSTVDVQMHSIPWTLL